MNEFQHFAAFVKRNAMAILAAAYMPVLTQSFFPFHRNGFLASQVPAAASGLLTILVVAEAFWLRKGIGRRGGLWLPIGLLLVLAGMGLITGYALYCNHVATVAGQDPDIYKLTTDQTLVAMGLYVIAFPVLLAGASIVFLFGYVRTEEPTVTLQAIAGDLSDNLKGFLARIAEAVRYADKGQLADGKELAGRAGKAFRAGACELIRETARVLDQIANGTLEIRGPAMDVVYGQCVSAVRREFRALSGDDLPYWASYASAEYLKHNARLIANRCAVERVFVVHRATPISDEERDAIRKQIKMGIVVRVAYFEKCGNIADDKELDFGLLDDFAVSFWRHDRGRVFRITAEAEQFKKYSAMFKRVRGVCEEVGDGTNDECTRLTIPTLDEWVKSHNS